MGGERLARAALALDAIYFGTVGVLFVVLRGRLALILRLPPGLIATAGAATAAWGLVVLGQAIRMDWRAAARQTAVVNAVASAFLGLGAALPPARGARALLVVTALEVGSFAVAQAISLTKRGRKD